MRIFSFLLLQFHSNGLWTCDSCSPNLLKPNFPTHSLQIHCFGLIGPVRAIQPDLEPDPPAPTVWSGPRTDEPDAGDGSAEGLYSANQKTVGRLAGLRLRNRYLTDPTVSNRKIAHFLSDLLRSDLNLKCQARSRRDLAWSLRDMPRSHWDSAISRQDRPDLFKILSRSGQVSLDSVTFGKIQQIFAQPETDRGPIWTRRKSDHPNWLRSPIGGGSKHGKPEVIGSVPG